MLQRHEFSGPKWKEKRNLSERFRRNRFIDEQWCMKFYCCFASIESRYISKCWSNVIVTLWLLPLLASKSLMPLLPRVILLWMSANTCPSLHIVDVTHFSINCLCFQELKMRSHSVSEVQIKRNGVTRLNSRAAISKACATCSPEIKVLAYKDFTVCFPHAGNDTATWQAFPIVFSPSFSLKLARVFLLFSYVRSCVKINWHTRHVS